MYAVLLASNFYSALATAVLFLHGLFILWVIFGALLARGRPMLRWLRLNRARRMLVRLIRAQREEGIAEKTVPLPEQTTRRKL